jgi:ABC-2 type transport system ATP-binding protein
MAPVIEARDVTVRRRQDRLALDHVSFAVEPGCVYALLGARGAGKTTAVDAFRGAVRLASGRASIDGRDAATEPRGIRRVAAFVARTGGLHDDLTPRQNARLFLRVAGVAVSRTDIDTALRRMGVPDRAFTAPVAQLETETRLLVSLAVAHARAVRALILDDPADGPDVVPNENLQDALDEFRRTGVAVLLATSQIPLAAGVADRVGILRSGVLATECTPSELLGQSLPQFLLDFAGSRSAAPPGARHD